MQCSIESNATRSSPARAGLRVNFTDKGEVKERREKFLTAKYGSHQMSLIRKRLAVEMWLYDELQKLYEPPAEAVDVDIDELLDMASDEVRKAYLNELLAESKKPQKEISV
ncbi:protein phosphatase 1 regulatory subunit 14B-like, partial [Ctenocephalides felis]|uniref:protein phosphatase 1 regulatory subunit 14B-like n=1 Tax=Ctenocephalides felis TaxID=7515 RepID=UPI000E6E2727